MIVPKISVIMGVYNCKSEELLHKSVISIINQTYKDWEFIICNDGSTDDTLEKLKKLECLDERIRIISYETNKGLAAALNKCIENATGEFIARQDDDDFSEPTRFEKQLSFLEAHTDFDIIGTTAIVVGDNGKWGEFSVPELPDRNSFFWNSPFLHPSVIIKSDSIKKVSGYRVAKETRRCEDYDLFMRMYAVGCKGYNLQENLYHYRIVIDPNKKYRPMKYRIDEAIVRFKGYKVMGTLLKGIPYVFKPIIIGVIPQKIFKIIREKQYKQ